MPRYTKKRARRAPPMNRNIVCAGCGERTQCKVGSADEDRFFRVGAADSGQQLYKQLQSNHGKLFFCDPMCWLDARVSTKPPPLSLLEPWYEKQGEKHGEKQGARFGKEGWAAVRRRLGHHDPAPLLPEDI